MTSDRVRGWLAALVGASLLVAPPYPSRIVEAVYSRPFFPRLQGAITSLTNLAPFALLDVFLLVLTLLIIRRAARLFRIARTAGPLAAIWDGLRRVVRAAGVLTILFMVMWGFNYRRTPLDQALHVAPPPGLKVEQLQQAVADANRLAAGLRPAIGASHDALTYQEAATLLRDPFNTALARLDRPALRTPGRPKRSVLLTPYFTWAGIDGMVDPFALESIVHPDLLPFERPFVLAHEWGHLAGAADEAEASAIGWFACMQGGPVLAYSASLYLIVQAGGVMPPQAWREASAHLDPAVLADLAALRKRLQRQRPIVRRTAFRVYDEYLRANRVEGGVASYDRALSLILAPPLRDALSAYRLR